MPIQVPAVHGCPAAVRALHPVGDHQMGVQQGVAFSGCPVVEADRQQALSGHVLDTATSKTYVSRLLAKLGARDRAQLVAIAYETGLVTPGSR
jgi:hypothetical protein